MYDTPLTFGSMRETVEMLSKPPEMREELVRRGLEVL
jgi:hypothetical protein